MRVLLPILLIVSLAGFNSTAFADKKTSKEIYAEILKKRMESKKKESPECKKVKEISKQKYQDINTLIAVSKAQYRKHSEVLGVKDMFRVVNVLIKHRVDVANKTAAACKEQKGKGSL